MSNIKLDLNNPEKEIFEVTVDGENFTVEVTLPNGLSLRPACCSNKKYCPQNIPPHIEKPTTEPTFVKGEHGILAPMPGSIISYSKQIGDTVKLGDEVVILEAMKMYNSLYAPCDGVIKSLPFSPGDNVKKFDVLCVVASF